MQSCLVQSVTQFSVLSHKQSILQLILLKESMVPRSSNSESEMEALDEEGLDKQEEDSGNSSYSESELESMEEDDDAGEDGDTADNVRSEEDEASNKTEKFKPFDSNIGWADAMRRILSIKKPPKKKTIVLTKAKKLSTVKGKKGEEADVKPSLVQMEKKKDLIARSRTQPNVLEKDKEKALAKIATRGVVQLFNAVNMHRKNDNIKENRKMKPETFQINKRVFLNMLKVEEENITIKTEDEEEDEESEIENDGEANCDWNVLKENFLTGSKLKNWDKSDVK